MRELIINGVTVDLDEKTQMDLQFVSFLFTSINSISAPRSWTVSLPKSAVNIGLIQGASSGDYAGDFPYNNYVVDYYNRGYRLINTGKGILTKIGSRIEFVFTFGNAFEKIKAMSETKLTSLTETATDYLTWNRSISLNNMTAGFGWCNFYSFTNEDRTLTTSNADIPFGTLHPTIKFDYIMNKIQSFFGVTLVGLSALVGGCSFPLRELEGISVLGRDTTVLPTFTIVEDFYYLEFSVGVSDFFETYENGTIQVIKVKDTVLKPTEVDINLVLTLNADAGVGNYIRLYLVSEDTSITYINFPRNPTTPLVYNISASKYFVGGGKLQYIYFKSFNNITTKVASAYLILTPKVKQAFYEPSTTGGFFPIIPNLPDMTCSDFIFQAMQLAGVFPEVTDDAPNTINFFSADTIIDNIGIAKDWTNKLVKNTRRMSELSDAEFKFGNYAQRNTLAYKADETNLLNTGDALVVQNVNLEKENKLVELKFAAGKRFSVSEKTIDYPLYDIKIDAGVLIRNPKTQSNDVLGKIVNVGGINYLQFTDDLLWSNIKATENYVAQQTLIDKPRYIKENFHLKPEDVYLFSAKIPIYLQQYGKYYAVMKLQYRESEFSECELLELKNV